VPDPVTLGIAVASAVAAVSSAFAATATWRISQTNLLNSVRPELMFSDWTRLAAGSDDSSHTHAIRAAQLRNHGRGPAFRVRVSRRIVSGKTGVTLCPGWDMELAPVIPVDVTIPLDQPVAVVSWTNEVIPLTRMSDLEVALSYTDVQNNEHVQRLHYELWDGEWRQPREVVLLADRFFLTDSSHAVTPAWRVRFCKKLRRIARQRFRLRNEVRGWVQRHRNRFTNFSHRLRRRLC
jgi:hypothetical protein